MKKESFLMKVIDIWSLAKVFTAGCVLWWYTIYLYFKQKEAYSAFLSVISDWGDGEVILVMSLEDYAKLQASLAKDTEESEPDMSE